MLNTRFSEHCQTGNPPIYDRPNKSLCTNKNAVLASALSLGGEAGAVAGGFGAGKIVRFLGYYCLA